jgi:hypothetical protein
MRYAVRSSVIDLQYARTRDQTGRHRAGTFYMPGWDESSALPIGLSLILGLVPAIGHGVAESLFDPVARRVMRAVQALRVDAEQDVDAMPSPLHDLGRWHAGIERRGHTRAAGAYGRCASGVTASFVPKASSRPAGAGRRQAPTSRAFISQGLPSGETVEMQAAGVPSSWMFRHAGTQESPDRSTWRSTMGEIQGHLA